MDLQYFCVFCKEMVEAETQIWRKKQIQPQPMQFTFRVYYNNVVKEEYICPLCGWKMLVTWRSS